MFSCMYRIAALNIEHALTKIMEIRVLFACVLNCNSLKLCMKVKMIINCASYEILSNMIGLEA